MQCSPGRDGSPFGASASGGVRCSCLSARRVAQSSLEGIESEQAGCAVAGACVGS